MLSNIALQINEVQAINVGIKTEFRNASNHVEDKMIKIDKNI